MMGGKEGRKEEWREGRDRRKGGRMDRGLGRDRKGGLG